MYDFMFVLMEEILKLLYFMMYVLYMMFEEVGMKDEYGRVILSSRIVFAGERIDVCGVYFVDDGCCLFLWFGKMFDL